MKNRNWKIIAVLAFLALMITFGDHPIALASEKINDEKEVIVVYKNESGKQEVVDQSLEVDYEFESLPAVSATLTETDIVNLGENPNIDYIEENIIFTLASEDQTFHTLQASKPLEQTASIAQQWNIDLVNAKQAWEDGYTGNGVKVAVLDTGIALHPELKITGGISMVDTTNSWKDESGHGTSVAGIIAAQPGNGIVNGIDVTGMAPNARLYSVKVLDQDGNGQLSDVLEGLDWAIQNNMDIVNMSFATEEDSPLFRELVDKAYSEGILLVGASGNQGNNSTVGYPAQYPHVIGVSSVNKHSALSSFSSVGNGVDYTAPGEMITSTSLNHQYSIQSGTSFSAPHVSGMLALLKEKYPLLSNSELEVKLQQYIHDLSPVGRDDYFGHGLIQYDSSIDPVHKVAENLVVVEKAIGEITLADQSRTLWDYASAKYTISQLPLINEKTKLQKSLEVLQQEIGLVSFTSLLLIKKDHELSITFTEKINKESINSQNLFIRKDGAFIEGLKLKIGEDEKSVIIAPPNEGFQSGVAYYLYIDRTITGKTGKHLKFPVVVMFTVK